jgi:ABC-type nitrate/sulfonate/bicarbonate transport system ATPase subunit
MVGDCDIASGGSDALLLDEPYAGLDADLRRSLTEPVHAREVPAVFVAHELAEAQAFADMHPERVAPARIPARG